MLELDKLSPVNNYQTPFEYERLVEDIPAHYVSATDAQYGVYDYDSGKPLPNGYKIVYRYLFGKMLIVLKNGPYNGITSTYDGRHGMCSNDEFRIYINQLIVKTKQLKKLGLDKKSILNCRQIATNPFDNKENHRQEKDYRDYKDPKDFIAENFSSWCFKDFLASNLNKGNILFYITFETGESTLSYFFDEDLYLCSDGYIKFLKDRNSKEIYCISNRDAVLALKEKCTEFVNNRCIQNDFDEPETYEFHFLINLKKSGKPTHLFTKEEIEEVMRNADDRRHNMLVIDEDGYAKIVQDSGLLYPVRHESWDAGNMYVGKYSKLLTLNDNYISSLQGWLVYLQSGRTVYMDYVHENTNEDILIKEIKKYY